LFRKRGEDGRMEEKEKDRRGSIEIERKKVRYR